MGRILAVQKLARIRQEIRKQGKKVVFTNGTFDIIHRGHVDYLRAARKLGDVLIVGLNTDASIRRIKGKGRPINKSADRAEVLSALACVDYVCLFRENTPYRLITALLPDVLVKGADWEMAKIVGSDVVEEHGGIVKTIRLTRDRSTTNTIERVLKAYCSKRGAGHRNA
jgi:rfaE bifunctional protein nucleotidyltransferase chain/domain